VPAAAASVATTTAVPATAVATAVSATVPAEPTATEAAMVTARSVMTALVGRAVTRLTEARLAEPRLDGVAVRVVAKRTGALLPLPIAGGTDAPAAAQATALAAACAVVQAQHDVDADDDKKETEYAAHGDSIPQVPPAYRQAKPG
jgi:hypothetical protein